MATTFAELFGIATMCDYPDPTDVRQGTTFDGGNQTGTLIVTPPIAPTPGTAGPITIQGGLISTTATLVGDVFEFQRLTNPTFAPGDVTITIGGGTTNTTNLPQTINGELVLELTEPENVIGAVIVLDNPDWTRVVIEIVEGGGAVVVVPDNNAGQNSCCGKGVSITQSSTEVLFWEIGQDVTGQTATLRLQGQEFTGVGAGEVATVLLTPSQTASLTITKGERSEYRLVVTDGQAAQVVVGRAEVI